MSAYLAHKEREFRPEGQKAAREELKQKPLKIPKSEFQDCSHEQVTCVCKLDDFSTKLHIFGTVTSAAMK